MCAFKLEPNATGQLLRLSGEITIEHARDLHATLLAGLGAATRLTIDASEVSRIDAAVLQVLLAAGRAAVRPEISRASAGWMHALQRFGFDSFPCTALPDPQSSPLCPRL